MKASPTRPEQATFLTEQERRRANKERIVKILDKFLKDENDERGRARSSFGHTRKVSDTP